MIEILPCHLDIFPSGWRMTLIALLTERAFVLVCVAIGALCVFDAGELEKRSRAARLFRIALRGMAFRAGDVRMSAEKFKSCLCMGEERRRFPSERRMALRAIFTELRAMNVRVA